jgi:hypothetical protein
VIKRKIKLDGSSNTSSMKNLKEMSYIFKVEIVKMSFEYKTLYMSLDMRKYEFEHVYQRKT